MDCTTCCLMFVSLIKSTDDWGPAWVFSTLPFESLNKKIVDSITSPNVKAEQVCTRFFMRKFIRRCAEEENISQITRKQIRELLDMKIENIPPGLPEAHYFVGRGRPEIRIANRQEMRLIAESGLRMEKNTLVKFYDKVVVDGEISQTNLLEFDHLIILLKFLPISSKYLFISH